MICPILAIAALTQSVNSDSHLREQVLHSAWQQLRPIYRGSPFTTAPNLLENNPGSLNQNFTKDAENFLVFLRLTAGIKSNFTLTPDLNEKAQWGANLLQANRTVAHLLPKPDSFTMDDYALASQGTAQSNLSRFHGRRTNLVEMIHLQTIDDRQNVWNVGHRRWFLNPTLQKLGFGFTQSGQVPTSYGAIIAKDQSDTHAPTPNYIAWPAAAAFPIELCPRSIPWSLSLNPKIYEKPVANDISIRLQRLNSEETWVFQPKDNADQKTDIGFTANFCGRSFGMGPNFTFRPPKIKYRVNDQFRVTISGLKLRDGQPTQIRYETRLFSLKHPVLLHAPPLENPDQSL